MISFRILYFSLRHSCQKEYILRPPSVDNFLNWNLRLNGWYLNSYFTRKSHRLCNPHQELIEDTSSGVAGKSKSIIDKVNNHIAVDPGRLFAVIHICGKQYRVVSEDIILIERNWPPKINDKLIFEKVLLLGGSSFTLIGKPILPRNIVKVTASIVHKDLTHTKVRYHYIPRKRVHNLNFEREELTYIRINDIEIYPKLNVMENTEFLRC